MELVQRTRMGKFAFLISAINAGYDHLDDEKTKYLLYDGGQPPFEETEIYIEEMEVIKDMERDLSSVLRGAAKPIVMGGRGSRRK